MKAKIETIEPKMYQGKKVYVCQFLAYIDLEELVAIEGKNQTSEDVELVLK